MNAARGSAWSARRRWSPASRAMLRLADAFRPLAPLFGVDSGRFLRLFELRLRLESSVKLLGASGSGGLAAGAGIEITMVATALSGLVPALAALAGSGPVAWMALGQGTWMFLIGVMTLNHFGNVLIEANEVPVLAHLPIGDRTVLAARFAHVLAYVLVLGATFAVLPTVAGCYCYDWPAAALAFPLATLSSGAVVLASVTLGYALLLRWTGAGRFQRASLWVQTAAMVVLVGGMQAAPHLAARWEAAEALAPWRPWLERLPPMHYAGLYRVLAGERSASILANAGVALALPLVLAAVAFAFVTRRFLAAIADSGALLGSRTRGFPRSLADRLGARLCRSRTAAAAFGFAAAMAWREKTFVRYVLPQAASFLAMSVVFTVSSRGLRAELVPFALYFLVLLALGMATMARWSEHAHAAWWFDVLPSRGLQELIEGSAKGLFALVFAPVLLALAAVAAAVSGPRAAADIALAIVAASTAALWIESCVLLDVPFTRALPRTRAPSAAENCGFTILCLVLAAALGAFHALVRMHWASHAAALLAFTALFARQWMRLGRGRKRAAAGRSPQPPAMESPGVE